MSEVHLTAENFQETISKSDKPVLVDFWAPWCGPCRMMSPVVEELAGEAEAFVVAKLNVDEVPEIAQQFNILSIPTFFVFVKGQVVDQFSGTMSKEDLKKKVEKHLG